MPSEMYIRTEPKKKLWAAYATRTSYTYLWHKLSITNCITGSLEHMLTVCPGLEPVRCRMKRLYLEKTAALVPLKTLVCEALNSTPDIQLQFILDPMAFDHVKSLSCLYGPTIANTLYYCSRTYVYYLHREKAKLLNQWSGDFHSP